VNPSVSESVFDFRGTEVALFVAGAIITIFIFGFSVWLFVRAAREQRVQEELERREFQRADEARRTAAAARTSEAKQ
jgi:uncharacterized membrane protein YciS (DUF1049 family)